MQPPELKPVLQRPEQISRAIQKIFEAYQMIISLVLPLININISSIQLLYFFHLFCAVWIQYTIAHLLFPLATVFS